MEKTDRLVPVCRDDQFCEEQRPGRTAQEAVNMPNSKKVKIMTKTEKKQLMAFLRKRAKKAGTSYEKAVQMAIDIIKDMPQKRKPGIREG